MSDVVFKILVVSLGFKFSVDMIPSFVDAVTALDGFPTTGH